MIHAKMILLSAMAWAALALACYGKDFPVTDADQQSVLFICDRAAMSERVTRQERAGVSQFCVQWEDRIKAAANAPEPKPKEDEQK